MKSVIIGAGTYGTVYFSYLKESGVEIVGFLDDDEKYLGKSIEGVPILGKTDILVHLKDRGIEAVYCPIGNSKVRLGFLQKAKELGFQIPNYIHSSVIISPNVEIGEGVYILLGSAIMPYTQIENYVMISMGVHIAHHDVLSEGTFLSTGVNFGASIVAHRYSYVGIGATIMTGIHSLGEDCLVGAGTVVIKDVPDKAIVAGVPAKILKYKDL